jgi:hypothetical protein
MATGTALAQEAPPPIKRHAPGLLAEPYWLGVAADMAGRYLRDRGDDGSTGLGIKFGGTTSGAGWLVAGPRYRARFLDDSLVLDASMAFSWHAYKLARLRLAKRHLAGGRLQVGGLVTWQDFTQVDYFGVGDATIEATRSAYRLQGTGVVAYAEYRPTRPITLSIGGGWLGNVRLRRSAGWFNPGLPELAVMFPDEPALHRADQPGYLYARGAIVVNDRDTPDHPERGGVFQASAATFADRDTGAAGFQRFEIDALRAFPMAPHKWLLIAHAAAMLTRIPDGNAVPFYHLPTLGGGQSLRAYPSFRFVDRQAAFVRLESRWALFTHLDVAGFGEAGTVAPTVSALEFSIRSYGLGIRLHAHDTTIARIDAGYGRDGWHLLFSLKDAFGLSRLTRRYVRLPLSW